MPAPGLRGQSVGVGRGGGGSEGGNKPDRSYIFLFCGFVASKTKLIANSCFRRIFWGGNRVLGGSKASNPRFFRALALLISISAGS